MEDVYEVAKILQAEGSVCGFFGMLVVWHVYTRNKEMRSVTPPSKLALFVALIGKYFDDPTGGAEFLFSGEDLKNPRVQKLVNGSPILVVNCHAGLTLNAY